MPEARPRRRSHSAGTHADLHGGDAAAKAAPGPARRRGASKRRSGPLAERRLPGDALAARWRQIAAP